MAPYLHEIWNLINFRINVGYFEAKAQIFKDCFQYMDMVVCIFIVYECLNFSSVYLKTPVATLNRNICPSSAIVSWHEMCFTGSRHISLISEQDLSSSSTWSMASLLLQSQWLMWCVTVSFPAPVIEKIKCTGTNILWPLSIEIRPQVPNRDPPGSKVMSGHAFLAFLGHFAFWMGMFKLFRWIGLGILIPKDMWKCKIGPLEQI